MNRPGLKTLKVGSVNNSITLIIENPFIGDLTSFLPSGLLPYLYFL